MERIETCNGTAGGREGRGGGGSNLERAEMAPNGAIHGRLRTEIPGTRGRRDGGGGKGAAAGEGLMRGQDTPRRV